MFVVSHIGPFQIYLVEQLTIPLKNVIVLNYFIIQDSVRTMGTIRLFSQAEELQKIMVPLCTESPESMKYCMQMYNLFYGREADFGPVSTLLKMCFFE